MIQPFLWYLLDPLTSKCSRLKITMINFEDRFSGIKKMGFACCTLIVILFLEQGVKERTSQHEKESSNRIQYKYPVKESSKIKQKQKLVRVRRVLLSARGMFNN